MKVAFINTNGAEQIAAALGKHHKLGLDHFTPSMLAAWASDAENSFVDGNGFAFEISAADARLGAAVVVTITPEGYDVEEVAAE